MNVESYTVGSLFTNTYIISNDNNECILIDPGLGYKKVVDHVKSKYDVKAILLTHAHIDHMDGIQYFLDVPVYMHTKEYDNFFDSEASLYNMFGRVCPYNEGMLDIRKVNHGDEFNLIGLKIKVLYTPGHTNGSVCFLIENKLFSGDTLFRGTCGRCDFPNGSVSDMQKSLNYLVNNLPLETVVYPGHDAYTTILDEKENNPYIMR
ncbi:MAG: MBL fold metallo-hydrolase [Acholeplasmatales bacterium]|nr:MBL fold metallo-hydrolase [Acholeplasmatales bacterium]